MNKIKVTKEEQDQLMEQGQIILLGDLFSKDGKLKKLERQVTRCKTNNTKLVSYKDGYYQFDDIRDIIEHYFNTISYIIYDEITSKIEQEETESVNNELC